MVTKFEEFTYTRPEFKEIEKKFEEALILFTNATSVDEQSKAILEQ